MRCIDAEGLEELFREVIGGIAKKPEMDGNLEHMVRASAMVIEMIKDAPTIEPQRKKGKWLFKERREPVYDISGVKTWGIAYMCSECGFIHTVIEDFGQYAYCPNSNCGADMTEITEESKRCDTCKHEKSRWLSRCADCSDYELWEGKQCQR